MKGVVAEITSSTPGFIQDTNPTAGGYNYGYFTSPAPRCFWVGNFDTVGVNRSSQSSYGNPRTLLSASKLRIFENQAEPFGSMQQFEVTGNNDRSDASGIEPNYFFSDPANCSTPAIITDPATGGRYIDIIPPTFRGYVGTNFSSEDLCNQAP